MGMIVGTDAHSLAGHAGCHLALIGLAFARPRLVLPATLALASGRPSSSSLPSPTHMGAPVVAMPVAIGAIIALWQPSTDDIRRLNKATPSPPTSDRSTHPTHGWPRDEMAGSTGAAHS